MMTKKLVMIFILGLTLASCGSDKSGEGDSSNNTGIVNPINTGNFQYQYCGNIVSNTANYGPTAMMQLNNSQVLYLYPENYSAEVQNILRSYYQARYGCVYSNTPPNPTYGGTYFYVQAVTQ